MDQINVKHSKCSISISDFTSSNNNDKKKVARRRWAILAKALKSPTGSEPSSPTDEFSVRRISSFMLLTTQQLESFPLLNVESHMLQLINKRTWYKYLMIIDGVEYFVVVGHRNRTFSAEDLMGFNNTGNICIWPSEETLSYYVGANLTMFYDKTVLELGGGMSCLAGLVCAKYGSAKQVTLTDGNKVSVENVKASIYGNKFTCPVFCKVLKWGKYNLMETYDVILCADCLFFDDARGDLIETLWNLLSLDGLGLIMAPKRGSTLHNFILKSEAKGFMCKQILNYSKVVWEKHLNLLNNCGYDENIHYPILIEMTKSKADYWKSQDKKYCDFCKCWIADNRPSVDFHEKGRKHQVNVSKRLKHITKQSARDQKESEKFDLALKKIESSALEAYQKDVQTNADISSVEINKKIQQANLIAASKKNKNAWYEAKSDDGRFYYWKPSTKETVWEAPKEGYVSINKQEFQRSWKMIREKNMLMEMKQKQDLEADKLEERARIAREKLKERRVVDYVAPTTSGPILPTGKTEPYGQWQTVKISEPVDLQLPQQPVYFEHPEFILPDPELKPIKEFKEKVVDGIEGSDINFKKRKLGSIKRNVRQRVEDD